MTGFAEAPATKSQAKVLLAAIMLPLILASMLIAGPAEEAQAITQSQATSKLDSIVSRYKNTYWTTDGKPCVSSSNCHSKYYYGKQCKGFAGWVFNEVFGTGYIGAYSSDYSYLPSPNGASLVVRKAIGSFGSSDGTSIKNAFANAAPGDFLQMRRRGKSYGHSMILLATTSTGIRVLECNDDGKCGVHENFHTWASFASKNSGFSIYRANGYTPGSGTGSGTGSSSASHNPVGVVDSVTNGGGGLVSVRGWAFDPDAKSESLEILVYIGGPGGSVPAYSISANKSRPDVNKAYNITGNHGFEAGLYTSRTGNVDVYIYAVNKGSGEATAFLGKKTVNMPKETEKPKISNVKVENISPSGYRISCTATDNVGIDRVEFPTWTSSGGQDDIIWHKGVKSGDTYYFDVKTSDHKGETGFYATHIYAYDAAGNTANSGATSSILVPVAKAALGDSVYYLTDVHCSWTDAQKECEHTYGAGHLAIIQSADEQELVKSLVKSGKSSYYYIGAEDASKEGTWTWVDGSELSGYSAWASGEPNGGTKENYATVLKSNGTWNDLSGASRSDAGFIMEVETNRPRNGEVVTDIEEGIYTIKSFKNSNYVVEIAAGSKDQEANVQLYKSNGTGAQRFKFVKNDDDTYTIINVQSNLALDVKYGGSDNLTNVWQYAQNDTASQRWYIEKGSDGCYFLRSKRNNMYLDVYGGVMANGQNVDVYQGNSTGAQKFLLTYADKPRITSSEICDVSPDGYTVKLTLEKTEATKSATFHSWTVKNDQDDMVTDTVSVNDGVVTYRVNTSAHKGEHGLYKTHIYVQDTFGNTRWLAEFNNVVVPTAIASHGTSTYYLVDASATWDEAKAYSSKQWYAGSRSGHLVAIETAEEQAVVAELASKGSKTFYFIGASDADEEGAWKWLSGASFDSYSNWDAGEPSGGTSENYAGITRANGAWNDLAGTAWSGTGFIVEVEGDDRVAPDISDVAITGLDEEGFSISCKVSDDTAVEKVRFGAYAVENGEESIEWTDTGDGLLSDAWLYDDGMTYCTVSIADHDDATGEYRMRILAYDESGNEGKFVFGDDEEIVVPDATYASDDCLFYRFDQPMTWTDAKKYVDSLPFEGMQLASIESEEDADAVAALLAGGTKSAYWIGLSADDSGSFAWADGSTAKYANWASGQPTKAEDSPYAAVLASNLKWYSCADKGLGGNTSNMGIIAKVRFAEDDTYYAEACEGEHTWGEWMTVAEATCEEPGSKERVCEVCGTVEKEELPLAAHVPGEAVLENEVAASCDTEGSCDSVVRCSVCGEELSRDVVKVPATGHTWGQWKTAVEPTCDADGLERRVCETDSSHVEEQAIGALGHELEDVVHENEVLATCTEGGHYDAVIYCSRCGKEVSRTAVTVDAGHEWSQWQVVTSATCTDTGLERRVCVRDTAHQEERVSAALGHDYHETVIAPTEDADGYTVHFCSRCGDAYVDTKVDSLGKQRNAAAAGEASQAIAALPAPGSLALSDADAVAAARAAYEALTADQKALVGNVDDLRAAEARLVELASADKTAKDKVAADAAMDAIKAIPTVSTLTKQDTDEIAAAKAAVRAAHDVYDKLTADQLALVTNANRLFAAEQVLAALEEQAEADIEAAADVNKKIAAISTKGLTPADTEGIAAARKAVDAARAAYDKLTADQKALVEDAETLFLAEIAVANLEQSAKSATDTAAAQTADAAIAAIPAANTLTGSDDDRAKVAAARAAYNALTVDQRALVTRYDRLDAAEKALLRIDKEAGGSASDRAASAPVTAAIEALPASDEVSVDDAADIAMARAAYDALTDAQRAIVPDEKLVLAETRLVELQRAQFNAAFEGAALSGPGYVARGGKATLTLPEDAAGFGSWTWASSNDGVAIVDAPGVIRGVSEGTATVSATCQHAVYGGEIMSATLELTMDVYTTSLADAQVNVESQTYSGAALTPAPMVILGNTVLRAGTDYTVAYSSNVNAGTATVIVTGVNAYAGTASGTFGIAPANLTAAQVTGVEDKVYSGSAQTQLMKVVVDGRTLFPGTDYDVSYANNVNVGTAVLTITGKGNYLGSTVRTFQITAAPASNEPETPATPAAPAAEESTAPIAKASIASAKVTNVWNATYNGKAQAQKPTVTLGGKVLRQGTDYKLSYRNNVKVGTATMTVTGIGAYSGTKSATFKVTVAANSLAKAKVTGAKKRTYNGTAQTQSPKVKLGKKALKAGRDYTVTYSRNVNAGTATATVRGIGAYSGSKSFTFKIAPAKLSKAKAGVVAQKYTGRAVTPSPVVKVGGKVLRKGVDYTVSYKNNVKKGTAKIVIKGKDNYTGSKTIKFKIK